MFDLEQLKKSLVTPELFLLCQILQELEGLRHDLKKPVAVAAVPKPEPKSREDILQQMRQLKEPPKGFARWTNEQLLAYLAKERVR